MNGLNSNKKDTKIEIANAQKRQEEFRDLTHKLMKAIIITCLIVAVLWALIIIGHLYNNDWDAFASLGGHFLSIVGGYLIGMLNKKFADL